MTPVKTKEQKQGIPDLVRLRHDCAHFAPYESSGDGFHQFRPGRSFKVYRSEGRNGRWIYQAAKLEPRDQLRPDDELKALLDGRSLEELLEQSQKALGQVFVHAHRGDAQAISKLAVVVRNAVSSLAGLARLQPAKVKAVAETFSQWPVLVSLNPQDIAKAKEDCKMLGVGTKAPVPTRPGQRVDRRNFWTRLAGKAHSACQVNRALVPLLQYHARGVERQKHRIQFWGTPAQATVFTLGGGDSIILTDWEKRCSKLSEPITKANFKEWQEAVVWCVLDHWQSCPEIYAAALKQIGSAKEKESKRRNLAVTEVRQAFQSLVGLR